MDLLPPKKEGFTLIEIMVILATVAILLGVSIPSLQDFFARTRLAAAANALYNDLQYARSEAITRNVNVYVQFTNGSNWCYALSDTSTCNCAETNTSAPDYCLENTVNYTQSSTNFPNVSLAETLTSNQILFAQLLGNISNLPSSPQTITLSSSSYSVNVTVDDAGLVTVCTNNGGIGSYALC